MTTPTGISFPSNFNQVELANLPKGRTVTRGVSSNWLTGNCAPEGDWRRASEADHNEREEFDMATQYLSENDISVIRERFHGWERASAKTLAAIFGVSVQRITAIVHQASNPA